MIYLLRYKERESGVNLKTLQFECNCMDMRIETFDTFQDFILWADADTLTDSIVHAVYHYPYKGGYKFEISHNFDYNRIMITCYDDAAFSEFIDILKEQLPQHIISIYTK